LGISTQPSSISGLGTLEFYRHAKSGNFELWGALGADGDAHLEHLRYIGQFLVDLPLAHLGEAAGDFDGDGDVDGEDLLKWQQGVGTTYDGNHLTDWETNYGSAPLLATNSAAVPEPSSLVLLSLGGFLVVPGARALYVV
jgi:hypothetical protein